MAKLSKCRTCSHTVSLRAKHCPSCGESRPGKRKIGAKGALVLVLISLAFAGGLSGRHTAHVVKKQIDAWAGQAADTYADMAAKIEPAAGDE